MKGLLLINLGTPDSPDKPAVKRYLREFLADKRVITLPAPLRYLLLYGFILPFRPKKAAHAYQAIWTEGGSPLLYHSQNLLTKLQNRLDKDYKVALGMRYGNPDIPSALKELSECETLTVLPLFPQYSSAATGSSLEMVLDILSSQAIFPTLHVIRDFYQDPGFIQTQARLIKPFLTDHEHVLFSYHGLPENHLLKGACKSLCVKACNPHSSQKSACYRAQCRRTTELIVEVLHLTHEQYSTSFQSRLGKTPWIKPYTDDMLSELAKRGIKNIAISCPSFVADCLETLEEIEIRAKNVWHKLGGKKLTLIPCLNDSDHWVDSIVKLIH